MTATSSEVKNLMGTTCESLRNCSNTEEIRASVFLYLHRAYESGMTPDDVVNLLGINQPNILDMSGLSAMTIDTVLKLYEELDPLISAIYGHE